MQHNEQKIRIAIADDHPIFRDALSRLFALESDFAVVAELGLGRQVLELLEQHRPDVLLLDLSLPDLDGLSILQHIQPRNLHTRTIVLTVSEDQMQHTLALRYGAAGIVTKSMPSDFLLEGIRRVYRGEICLDEKTLELVVDNFKSPRDPIELTDREREIISLVCLGLRNKEIADQLFISESTVKSHLYHIYDKLGVNDRTHLVRYALAANLVTG